MSSKIIYSKEEVLKYLKNELELMVNSAKIRHDAELHSEWFSQIVKQIYRDAFIHGSKHAIEEMYQFLQRMEKKE